MNSITFKISACLTTGLITLLVSLFCFCEGQKVTYTNPPSINDTSTVSTNPLDSLLTTIATIEELFQKKSSGAIVTVKGTVVRVLSDDVDGDRHQRFIIRLSNSQTLLIVHNVDIAPRVAEISLKDTLYVHGEYIWNDQGGLVHWTHHDPAGTHENGWIVLEETRYQ